ncbi:hypothetical protein [Nocardiopsis sp. CNR-923]|uniref:hypothetical protein n=1 Tax=Nocardiopsis sp. CNR-923 TaxID=1904965 RepID=UPI0021CC5D2E|nr:hypothetical protein [Nocardiopsis sp. CNR-923]
MPESTPSTDADIPQITELLDTHYDLPHVRLDRLPIGQGAINYRATTGDRTVFVKRYPPGTDMARRTTPSP